MPRPLTTDRTTRRRLLAATGVALTGAIAGCSGGGGGTEGDDGGNGDGSGDGGGTGAEPEETSGGGGTDDTGGGDAGGDTTSTGGEGETAGGDETTTDSGDGMLPAVEFPAPTDTPGGLATVGGDLWLTSTAGAGTNLYRQEGFGETSATGWSTELPGGAEVTGVSPSRRGSALLGNAATNELVTYSTEQRQQVGRASMPVTRPTGMTTDFNGRVWVVDHRDDGDYVVGLSASGDEVLNEYETPGESAWGLSMGDGTMYVTDPDAEQVHALETRQFTVEESYDVGMPSLRGVVFHEKLWVAAGGDAPTVAGFGL